MKRQPFLKSSTSGFTMLEVLVVIILMGILFAIAAPNWVAFLNNQRVNTARNQITQTLRDAQAQAKRTKVNRAVVVYNNNNELQMAIDPVVDETTYAADPKKIGNWQTLGNGVVQSGLIQLLVNGTPLAKDTSSFIVFDSYGNVSAKIGGQPGSFVLTVKPTASTNPRRCVAVQTLLGALSEASNPNCP